MATDLGFDVHLLDHDEAFCRSAHRLLAGDGRSVRRFADAEQLIAFASDRGPACAIVDIQLPGENGLAVQSAIREHIPHVPVIFVARRWDVRSCVDAMRRGAIELLEKPVAPAALRGALTLAEAASRDQWRRRMAWERARERFARLTRREREVLDLLVAGQRNKQIAYALSSEESTIKVHRSRLMRKLDARSLVDVLRLRQELQFPAPSA
jgi:FixJ family two-component response regulator